MNNSGNATGVERWPLSDGSEAPKYDEDDEMLMNMVLTSDPELNEKMRVKKRANPKPYFEDRVSAIGMVALWAGTLLDGNIAFWKGIFSRPKGLSHHRYFIYAGVRSFGDRKPDNVFGAFSRPTVEQCIRLTRKRGYQPEPTFVALDEQATGIWIGPTNAKEVMLYFHGGGYSRAAAPSHLSTLWDCAAKCRKNGKDFAIFALAYTLAPEAQYPAQLRQAVYSLKYLLEVAQLDYSDIILAGDSAGGNLALALVSHLLHPHPLVPHVRQLNLSSKPFRGLFLMCPWVCFGTNSRSMKKKEVSTYFTRKVLKVAKERYLGEFKEDVYSTPLRAPPEWWANLPFESIGVVAGEFESFLDDITTFVQKLKAHNHNVNFVVAPRETHDAPIFDKEAFPFSKTMTKTEQFFQEWTLQNLKSERRRTPFLGKRENGDIIPTHSVTTAVGALPGGWVDDGGRK